MNKEQVLGFVRHLLTFGGGFVVAMGWFDAATIEQISGAIITVLGVVWSFMAPEKKVA